MGRPRLPNSPGNGDGVFIHESSSLSGHNGFLVSSDDAAERKADYKVTDAFEGQQHNHAADIIDAAMTMAQLRMNSATSTIFKKEVSLMMVMTWLSSAGMTFL